VANGLNWKSPVVNGIGAPDPSALRILIPPADERLRQLAQIALECIELEYQAPRVNGRERHADLRGRTKRCDGSSCGDSAVFERLQGFSDDFLHFGNFVRV